MAPFPKKKTYFTQVRNSIFLVRKISNLIRIDGNVKIHITYGP